MRSSLVLTIIGPDRTGLVEDLANAVSSHGGNWLESRMARLAGKFAGVLRVNAPTENLDSLKNALRQLDAKGLHLVIESTDDPHADDDARTLSLNLIGHDRPGIVRDVARALAQRGVNVIEFHTQVISAPMTGEPLFKACATLHASRDSHVDELRDTLDRIADELNLDLHLDEPA